MNLIDANYCTDSARFISALVLSLSIMIALELPHLNVLSKMDLLQSYDRLRYSLEFYTTLSDLTRLADDVQDELARTQHDNDDSDSILKTRNMKYFKLNKALCDLLEDYNLVGFYSLAIEDKESLAHLSKVIDRANGFIFGGLEFSNEAITEAAVQVDKFYTE